MLQSESQTLNVLVLSSTASAINYIKVLGADPSIELHVTDADPLAGGLYEPHITAHVIPRASDVEAYKQRIEKIIETHNIDILLPTSDKDIEGVMRLVSGGWNPRVRMFSPNPDVYELMSDKKTINTFGLERGLPVPREYTPESIQELPVVVKPTREGGSKGVVIANTIDQVHDAISEIEKFYGGEYVIQQYIPGGLGKTCLALMLYSNAGEYQTGVVTYSTLTYFTWGGGGNAGFVKHEPELLEIAKKIVAECGGWKGPINLEFKQHEETDEWYLMEINCRLNGYSYLTSMNGYLFPRMVVDVLLGNPISPKRDVPESNFVLGFRERIVEKVHEHKESMS